MSKPARLFCLSLVMALSGPLASPSAESVPLPVARPAAPPRAIPMPMARPERLDHGVGTATGAPNYINGIPIPVPRPDGLGPLSDMARRDRDLIFNAFSAAKTKKWSIVRRLAGSIGDPLAAKLVTWIYLTESNAKLSFEELSHFIDANPDWPRTQVLLRRAEAAMAYTMDGRAKTRWFRRHPARSGVGRLKLTQALFETDRRAEAIALLRRTWVSDNFPRSDEKRAASRYRSHLTRAHHVERLDRLLWEGRYYPAKRMYRRVGPDWRLLANARLALRRRSGGVDRAIARVPGHLRDDAGLLYERLRWRRRKGMHDRAQEILLRMPGPPALSMEASHPEMWWRERAIQTRKMLAAGEHGAAYRLASEHDLHGGADYAEAEWLSGWIALRFQDKPKTAYRHFMRMRDVVRLPISVARATYWAARAADADGQHMLAARWFREAAKSPTTYYGQLAAQRVRSPLTLALPAAPGTTGAETISFHDLALVRALRLLSALGETRRLTPFFIKLNGLSDAPGHKALVATLAHSMGRFDLGIRIAKLSLAQGLHLAGPGYPIIDLPALPETAPVVPEVALVLALARQESAFDFAARSRAGAQGLMQLMPATARLTARRMKVPYSRERLYDTDYNASLGMFHLGELLEIFEGSYILSLAAYNAGKSRADKWMRDNGDPRHPDVDTVDWVEQIPFSETRNYVQRVMENLQVYRHRLAEEPVRLQLAQDINRAARETPYFVIPKARPKPAPAFAGGETP